MKKAIVVLLMAAGSICAQAPATIPTDGSTRLISGFIPLLNSNFTGLYNLRAGAVDCSGTPGAFVVTIANTSVCRTLTWSAISGLSGFPAFPSGAIVGTTDAQTLTGKTVDGVTPTVFGYLDPTSSIQTQLNSKEGAISAGSTAQYWRGDKTWQTLNSSLIVSLFGSCASTQYLGADGLCHTPSTGTGTGTVSSVGLDVTAVPWLAFPGSAVTTAGNLAITRATGLTANQFLATPNGATGSVGLRGLVSADIPNNAANTTGNAGTATSLASNGTNCPAGSYALGVDASGNSEGCTVAAGSGTVTNVTLTATPAWMTVTNPTVTTTGTITLGAAAGQAPNQVLATPNISTGAVALRSLVPGDLPTIPLATGVSGTLLAAQEPAHTGDVTGSAGSLALNVAAIGGVAVPGNTGSGSVVRAVSPTLTTPALGTVASGDVSAVTGTANSLTSGLTKALKSTTTSVDVSTAIAPSGGQVLTATDSTHATWQTITGTGTVTSVDMTVPSFLSVSGGPIRGAGSLAVTAATGQTANQVLATPNGATGAAALRSLVPSDIPTLNQNTTGTASNVTGVVATANGGSGVTTSTGTVNLVLSNSPTLVTPVLGAATATSVNKVSITPVGTGATLTIADGKALTASNSLTLTGTDGSSVAFGAGGTAAYTGNNLGAFASTTSAQLAGVLTDETGSGAVVLATSPTLVTPNLGIPTTAVLTNATGTAAGLTAGLTNGLKSATTNIDVAAAAAPSSGQVLTATDGTHATWVTPTGSAGGSGAIYSADTGTQNHIIVTPSPALSSYSAGTQLVVRMLNTNSGATDINVNGLGVKTVKSAVGNQLPGGALSASGTYLLVYDGTGFQYAGTGSCISHGVGITCNGTSGNYITMFGSTSGNRTYTTETTGANDTVNIAGYSTSVVPTSGNCAQWGVSGGQPILSAATGPCGTAGSTINTQLDGAVVGTAITALNILTGPDMTPTLTHSAGVSSLQYAPNGARWATRDQVQSDADRYCSPSSASSSAYACVHAHPLTAYTAGMTQIMRFDVTGSGGAITVALDSLLAKKIFGPDGTTALTTAQSAAGVQGLMIYDGSLDGGAGGWKFQTGGGTTSSGSGTVYAADSGSANAITATAAGFTFTPGGSIFIKMNASNTGATTATINGTTKNVKTMTIQDPPADALHVGAVAFLVYDGTQLQLEGTGNCAMTSTGIACASVSSSSLTLGGSTSGQTTYVGPAVGASATYRIAGYSSATNPTSGNCMQWNSLSGNLVAGDSGSPCGSSGGGTPISTLLTPFGGLDPSFNVISPGVVNKVLYWQINVPSPGIILHHINAWAPATGYVGNMAIGVYDSSCNKFAQSTTVAGNGTSTVVAFPFSSVSLAAGAYYVAFGSDTAASGIFEGSMDGQASGAAYTANVINAGETSTSYKMFAGGNASSTSGGTTTLPASCGTRTAPAIGALFIPFISLQ